MKFIISSSVLISILLAGSILSQTTYAGTDKKVLDRKGGRPRSNSDPAPGRSIHEVSIESRLEILGDILNEAEFSDARTRITKVPKPFSSWKFKSTRDGFTILDLTQEGLDRDLIFEKLRPGGHLRNVKKLAIALGPKYYKLLEFLPLNTQELRIGIAGKSDSLVEGYIEKLGALRNLRRLEIKRLSHINSDDFRPIYYLGQPESALSFPLLTQLRSLSLDGIPVSAERISSWSSKLPSLNNLTLSRTIIGDEHLSAISGLSALQALSIEKVTTPPLRPNAWYTSQEEISIGPLTSLLQLKSLKLRFRSVIQYKGLPDLRKLPHLRDLDLSHAILSQEDFAAIGQLHDLETLILKSLPRSLSFPMLENTDPESYRKLSTLTQLRELDLEGNFFGDKCIEWVGALGNLKRLNLRKNRLGNSSAELLSQLEGLESLEVSLDQFDSSARAKLSDSERESDSNSNSESISNSDSD